MQPGLPYKEIRMSARTNQKNRHILSDYLNTAFFSLICIYSCTVPLQSLLDQAASRLDMKVGDVGYNITDRSVPEWDVYSQREVGIRCFEHDLLATQRSGLKILVSIFCYGSIQLYTTTILQL